MGKTWALILRSALKRALNGKAKGRLKAARAIGSTLTQGKNSILIYGIKIPKALAGDAKIQTGPLMIYILMGVGNET